MSGSALNRRKILLGGTTLAAASAIGAGPSVPVAQAQLPPATQFKNALPNIVFILMDNLGYGEVGVYGGGITRGAPTPRIGRLAAEGMRLTNFNVEAQCTPSRSAIMTGRFAIRSGTHSVPIGDGLEGLTQWEVTIADLLSAAGYATGHFGKWHLGSDDGRLPNDQGFDEWYGIPRTTDEAFWPSEPAAKAAGAAFEHIMEGRKGEKSRALAVYDLEQRRLIDAEITRRTIDFVKRSVGAGKPFYAYVPFTLMHFPRPREEPHHDNQAERRLTVDKRRFGGDVSNDLGGKWCDGRPGGYQFLPSGSLRQPGGEGKEHGKAWLLAASGAVFFDCGGTAVAVQLPDIDGTDQPTVAAERARHADLEQLPPAFADTAAPAGKIPSVAAVFGGVGRAASC
jgi:hypothetical protein